MDEEATAIVERLAPEDGWWKSDTCEVIEEVAENLLKVGLNPSSVYEMLDSLIDVIRAEYGD